ncbi:hypothetical protein ACFO5R_22030 [Halosolutus amylolyticus]|uniref:Cox cluster protein n=1 Tax=Halosolutus amylolyticus TaxID=2932267 RepID=A0ABD5PVY6_9EURY|nr:hypothetical protein [Halosolutus amylolyticus]
MADHTTRTDDRTTASPWPFLLAVSLVLSEVGILVGLGPLAVGGLVLFVASVAGFVAESNHVTSPWPIAAGLGIVFVAGGTFLYAVGTDLLTIAGSDALVGLATRGTAIAVAGAFAVLGAVIGRYRDG